MLLIYGVGEDSLNPLDCKEMKQVNPKGNQSWIFIGRTGAEAETLMLWPPDGKNWLLGKHLDAGKDWRREGKGMTEDEMVGWHHRLDGHEFEQALKFVMDLEDWRAPVHGGHKELDTTEWLNWTEQWEVCLVILLLLLSHISWFFWVKPNACRKRMWTDLRTRY